MHTEHIIGATKCKSNPLASGKMRKHGTRVGSGQKWNGIFFYPRPVNLNKFIIYEIKLEFVAKSFSNKKRENFICV